MVLAGYFGFMRATSRKSPRICGTVRAGLACTLAVLVAACGHQDAAEPTEGCGVPYASEPLRRLSPEQYANTLRDLFPRVALPPLTLVPNQRGLEFDHLAEDQMASALWAYQVYKNASAVAAAVVHTDAVVLITDLRTVGRAFDLDVALWDAIAVSELGRLLHRLLCEATPRTAPHIGDTQGPHHNPGRNGAPWCLGVDLASSRS